jgi:acetylornithine deacetylase/succinyl-diaminopimelate desuccinylase-like protein
MDPLRAVGYARRNRSRFVDELKQFVRFPTVSSQPRHDGDLRRCSQWLAMQLRRAGLEQVHVLPTRHHPLVFAASRRQGHRPTVLIYGHYDVQPAEPVEEWNTPPFNPTVKDGNLYGRGACDDKGQLFTHVKALESFLKTVRTLPVNVKCIFEGDEETGSPDLRSFVERNKTYLASDVAVVSDTRMLERGRPAIGYAQRGTVRFELEVSSGNRELHSGNFGGAVQNPLQVLCEIVASLHTPQGRIAFPGSYDNVRRWSQRERGYMSRVGPADTQILRDAGVEHAWGEPGFTAYERVTIRPALSLHGLSGGYEGRGVKTVIPPRALAKLSVRIVPDQDPAEVARLFREHVSRLTPPGIRVLVRTLGSSSPVLVDRDHPVMRAAAFAYRKSFAASPVFLRSGGSVPAASVFQEMLGIPTVLMGFGLPDDHAHGPNERFHLPNFYRGIEASIWFLTAIGRMHHLRKPHADRKEAAA